MSGGPQCPHCGAPLTDLAAANCAYCGGALYAASGPNVTLQGLATASAADVAAVERALPQLAAQLQAALPGHVEIDRGGRGLLRRGPAVRAVRVTVGDQLLSLSLAPRGGVEATVAHAVRGVTLARREVTVAEWLTALQAGLAGHPGVGAGAAGALARLLG